MVQYPKQTDCCSKIDIERCLQAYLLCMNYTRGDISNDKKRRLAVDADFNTGFEIVFEQQLWLHSLFELTAVFC